MGKKRKRLQSPTRKSTHQRSTPAAKLQAPSIFLRLSRGWEKQHGLRQTAATVRHFLERRHKWVVVVFFALFLCLGILVFRDYGISWDEAGTRNHGVVALNFALSGDQELLTYKYRYYGPAFEMLLYGIERALKLTDDERSTFLMRHLVTFLLFFVAVCIFYRMCASRFGNWKLGLLGSLFLILSPRIFAHSFYNSKDIGSLSMFVISIYTLIRYLDRKTVAAAVLHGCATGLLLALRLPGVVVPALTLVFSIGDLAITRAGARDYRKAALSFLTYAIVLVGVTILFWPILWKNPLDEFIKGWQQMSRYPWRGVFLYMGSFIPWTRVPWHYVPVWIAITTPVLYICCFLVGCLVLIKRFVTAPIQSYKRDRNDLIILCWFFAPLFAVIFMGSIVYDAWRHLFFVYPAFLLVSLVGLTNMSRWGKRGSRALGRNVFEGGLVLVTALSLIGTAGWMVKYHPHQNVYFNEWAGWDMAWAKRNFELDYWGVSYKQALEYIVRNDPRKTIKIHAEDVPGELNAMLLPPEDRKRLVYVEKPKGAEYFVSIFRWHPDEFTSEPEYFSVKVGGARIVVVYKQIDGESIL